MNGEMVGEKEKDGMDGWGTKFDQENRRKEKELNCFFGEKTDRRKGTARVAV